MVDFLKWLATAAALPVVSSYVVDLIKYLAPEVEDRLAVLVSIAVAALASVLGIVAQPYLADIPSEVETFWPIIVWAIQQAWYQLFNKDHEPIE